MRRWRQLLDEDRIFEVVEVKSGKDLVDEKKDQAGKKEETDFEVSENEEGKQDPEKEEEETSKNRQR